MAKAKLTDFSAFKMLTVRDRQEMTLETLETLADGFSRAEAAKTLKLTKGLVDKIAQDNGIDGRWSNTKLSDNVNTLIRNGIMIDPVTGEHFEDLTDKKEDQVEDDPQQEEAQESGMHFVHDKATGGWKAKDSEEESTLNMASKLFKKLLERNLPFALPDSLLPMLKAFGEMQAMGGTATLELRMFHGNIGRVNLKGFNTEPDDDGDNEPDAVTLAA